MAERLTQEFIEKEVEKRGYKLLNKCVNSSTKMILQDVEEYLYVIRWGGFQQGNNLKKFHKSNPYTIQNIKLWMKTNAIGYELLSTEYINNHTKLLFKCPKGHEFEMTWSNFQKGQRCSVCSGREITSETCIATTDPWMVKFFKNKEDAYTHRSRSGAKIPVVCPYCGREKEMMISNIYKRKDIACICGDGISYSEKFIISILDQLKIKYIREYSPKWSIDKKYDFYLENYNCIIECHGGQHYNNHGFNTCGGRTLKEEQDNDKYKKELALENNIDNYIILNCSKSDIEYIKNSVLNSNLSKIVDLSNINWLKCEEFALSNKVKEVCDYWKEHNEINNEELTTTDVGKVFNLSTSVIYKYINKGVKLGWCSYNNKEERKKVSSKCGKIFSKPVEIFKDEESLGVFSSTRDLEKQSEELFGVKLHNQNIGAVCRGKQKTSKGYTFRYISKEEYEERTKQIKNDN